MFPAFLNLSQKFSLFQISLVLVPSPKRKISNFLKKYGSPYGRPTGKEQKTLGIFYVYFERSIRHCRVNDFLQQIKALRTRKTF